MSTVLVDSYKAVRSIETLENYALADLNELKAPGKIFYDEYHDEKRFWQSAFKKLKWGTMVWLDRAAFSTWVPRVPGLYWSPGAAHMRTLANSAVEYTSRRYTKYQPRGKSQLVLGGIGTHKLPPDRHGRQLASICMGLNASSGIPVLVYPDVWEAWRLEEGDVIDLEARWTQAELEWAGFEFGEQGQHKIPRGYLVLEHPEQIKGIRERNAPTRIHPYTVMEYISGDVRLYDFVFASADTAKNRYRERLETFFTKYKDEHERYGRYLISADISDPLWAADYASPSDLRALGHDSRAKLALIKSRVSEVVYRGLSTDAIIQLLAGHYDDAGLKRISRQAGLPWQLWHSSAPVADLAPRFVNEAVQQMKLEAVVENAARDYPELFSG